MVYTYCRVQLLTKKSTCDFSNPAKNYYKGPSRPHMGNLPFPHQMLCTAKALQSLKKVVVKDAGPQVDHVL